MPVEIARIAWLAGEGPGAGLVQARGARQLVAGVPADREHAVTGGAAQAVPPLGQVCVVDAGHDDTLAGQGIDPAAGVGGARLQDLVCGELVQQRPRQHRGACGDAQAAPGPGGVPRLGRGDGIQERAVRVDARPDGPREGRSGAALGESWHACGTPTPDVPAIAVAFDIAPEPGMGDGAPGAHPL